MGALTLPQRAALVAGWLGLAACAHATELPPEGSCADEVRSAAGDSIDATRAPLRPGTAVEYANLAALRALLPGEVWQHRGVFFFDGMRLTIGPCHRRYAPSGSFAAASRLHAGRVRLNDGGALMDHVAGLPFAPESIDRAAEDAGVRWAWNLERRHRAAGPRGSFRIVELQDSRALARGDPPMVFSGSFFFAQTSARADLPGQHERAARHYAWVAGGEFREPAGALGLAWRQYRLASSGADAGRADDVFVYLPELRKTRRGPPAQVDGMFVPRYRAAGSDNARVLPYAQGGRMGAIDAGHAGALAVSEDAERGFTGLALRPSAWAWRVVGEQEVVAPLNARVEGWPLRDGRNHGPSGLSLASDTWDVRWAVVIEGQAKEPGARLPHVTYWVDAQTAQPLYVMRRSASGTLREVGILAHRYSGDVPSYPTFPNGEPANVFDPVAASFLGLPSGSWRRESWDVRSTPIDAAELRALVSTDSLSRGR
jgi:hypothetical protein